MTRVSQSILALLLGLLLPLQALAAGPATAPGAKGANVLMMATTTSTNDTGLLDYLAPLFQKDTGIELRWTSTGTGKALELGKSCDVDVLLVHAPAAEKKFMEDGYGQTRTQVMYNDFVLIGPAADPAKVKSQGVVQALDAIRAWGAAGGAGFASRGDDSGTDKMEKSLWKKTTAGQPDKQPWYIQVGQGMMQTIRVALERGAYTLTDRGTFLAYEAVAKGDPYMAILVEGDKALLNQYSVITLNPDKCPMAKGQLAKAFSDWLASPKGQTDVAAFKAHGKQLFFPNAGK